VKKRALVAAITIGQSGGYDRLHGNHSRSNPDNTIVNRNRFYRQLMRQQAFACAADHRQGFAVPSDGVTPRVVAQCPIGSFFSPRGVRQS
jgi:hypothetical protein